MPKRHIFSRSSSAVFVYSNGFLWQTAVESAGFARHATNCPSQDIIELEAVVGGRVFDASSIAAIVHPFNFIESDGIVAAVVKPVPRQNRIFPDDKANGDDDAGRDGLGGRPAIWPPPRFAASGAARRHA